MIEIGDVVEVKQFPGDHWIVMGQAEGQPDPTKRCWRLRQAETLTGRVAGEGDLAIVSRPVFVPGQVLAYEGEAAQVIADNGNTVAIVFVRPRPHNLRRGKHIATGRAMQLDVARGELVAENWSMRHD